MAFLFERTECCFLRGQGGLEGGRGVGCRVSCVRLCFVIVNMTDIVTLSKLPSTSFLLHFRLVFSSLVEIALGMKDATSPAYFRMHLRL